MNMPKPVSVIFLSAVLLCTGFFFPLAGRGAEPEHKTVVIPLFHDKQAASPSFLSIPFTAFTGPNGGLGALLSTGACWLNNGTILVYLQAPVFLPQGALVTEVTVHYYYYYPGDSRTVQLLRMNQDGATTALAQINCNDQYNGHGSSTAITNPTIDNENYTYFLYAFGFNCDRKHAIRWVRIKYDLK